MQFSGKNGQSNRFTSTSLGHWSFITNGSFTDHLIHCWILLSIDSTQTSWQSVTSLILIGSVPDPSPQWLERLQNNHNVRNQCKLPQHRKPKRWKSNPVADLHRKILYTRPRLIFSISMQFSAKFGQKIGWHPLLGNPGSAADSNRRLYLFSSMSFGWPAERLYDSVSCLIRVCTMCYFQSET